MPQTLIRGMAWRHRRALDPLLAASAAYERTHPQVRIAWDARPLQGFEFTPVADLARAYDLIVLDHPFMGEAARDRCIEPLDDVLPGIVEGHFIGPSLATYRYGGALWAVPVDAACQTAAHRPDLLQRLGSDIPNSLDDVMSLGRRAEAAGMKLAMALAGVHALMTLFTCCAALGRPCDGGEDAPFADQQTAGESLAIMRDLLGCCDPAALDWNSIALHEAMQRRDDLVYCPAVYCYLTYAEADQARSLRFSDLPALRPGAGPSGSTVGGAGVALSAQSRVSEAAAGFMRVLAEPETQRDFLRHHGQPARIEAWTDAQADERFGGAFSAVRRTLELSWIRPRWPGYLSLQSEGGRLIEAHLRGEIGARETIDRLNLAAEQARG